MSKGKSKRRIKDWQVRLEAGEDVEGARARKQKFSPRDVKLGQGAFGGGEAETASDRRQETGMVTGVFRRGAFVRLAGKEWFCGVAKTFRPPEGSAGSPLTIGDDVTVALTRAEHIAGRASLDRNRMEGMILSRRPRRTLLARPQPRSAKRRGLYDEQCPLKAIAANMDGLLIVSATARPAPRRGLIDRFCILAERGGLTPVLVVNKIDLAGADESLLAGLCEQGVEIHRCSARSGAGVEALRPVLAGRRSVLAGASGVGKTSLMNVLVPGAAAATREVRDKDDRGRHTTSQARIYDLPDGGLLVDTPGLRELGVGITPAELPWYFPEFEAFQPQCKFRDCTHTHEPACAVRDAVEAGELPRHRYESYLRILDTL